MVHVCAGEHPRLDEGVDAVVDELRALEAHHGGLRELARHEALRGRGGGAVRGEREGGEEGGGEVHGWAWSWCMLWCFSLRAECSEVYRPNVNNDKQSYRGEGKYHLPFPWRALSLALALAIGFRSGRASSASPRSHVEAQGEWRAQPVAVLLGNCRIVRRDCSYGDPGRPINVLQ